MRLFKIETTPRGRRQAEIEEGIRLRQSSHTSHWAFVLGLFTAAFLTFIPAANAFKLEPYTQTTVNFCFQSNISTSQRSRVKDSANTWAARSSLGWTNSGCPDTAALDIRKEPIDGVGGALAFTQFNALFHPVYIRFDSGENWYNGTAQQTGQADFWGAAAHEMGHVFGLDHPGVGTAPEGAAVTMQAGTNYYSGGGAFQRDLSSDDEAGAHYITDGNYVPDFGFEGAQDCSSVFECISINYWTTNSSHISCSVSNPAAYQKSCVMVLPGVGGFDERVRLNNGSSTHTFSFQVHNAGSSSGTIRAQVLDVTDGTQPLNSTCSVPADSGWHLCAFSWQPSSGAQLNLHLFDFTISSQNSSPTLWIDSVRGTDR